jgi:uncharacterized cupin superfamily protein
MKIIKTSDQPWTAALDKGQFKQRRKPLGTEGLGASLWELPPGKKSFPFHMHHVTEEALYVVSGTMKVRSPEGVTAVGPGDFVSFPPGDAAHQLINDGTEPCTYLGLSVSKGVDIVEYPDSHKVATAIGAPPKGQRYVFQKDSHVDYFLNEKDAE